MAWLCWKWKAKDHVMMKTLQLLKSSSVEKQTNQGKQITFFENIKYGSKQVKSKTNVTISVFWSSGTMIFCIFFMAFVVRYSVLSAVSTMWQMGIGNRNTSRLTASGWKSYFGLACFDVGSGRSYSSKSFTPWLNNKHCFFFRRLPRKHRQSNWYYFGHINLNQPHNQ